MKKPYQIEAQRAVKQLEAMAAEGNPAVQMVLPMAEMVGWLRKGVGELIRQAGLQLMDLLMQEEVRELAGERSQRQAERTASRWGSERGYCVVMGQKVPIERPRVRTMDDKEVRLGSYEMFHRGEPLQHARPYVAQLRQLVGVPRIVLVVSSRYVLHLVRVGHVHRMPVFLRQFTHPSRLAPGFHGHPAPRQLPEILFELLYCGTSTQLLRDLAPAVPAAPAAPLL